MDIAAQFPVPVTSNSGDRLGFRASRGHTRLIPVLLCSFGLLGTGCDDLAGSANSAASQLRLTQQFDQPVNADEFPSTDESPALADSQTFDDAEADDDTSVTSAEQVHEFEDIDGLLSAAPQDADPASPQPVEGAAFSPRPPAAAPSVAGDPSIDNPEPSTDVVSGAAPAPTSETMPAPRTSAISARQSGSSSSGFIERVPVRDAEPKASAPPTAGSTRLPVNSVPHSLADLAANPGNLSIFVAALQQTGIGDTVSQRNRQYTAFAPTDEAFAESGVARSELLRPENRDKLVHLVRRHLVLGSFDAGRVGELGAAMTVEGSTLALNQFEGALMVDNATVVASDQRIGQLLIHSIDQVLEDE